MTGEFVLREHTADVAVEATGESASAVFGAVADGLAAAMCDEIPETGGDRFEVECEAENLDGLLYDYLGKLIYERDVRGVLPVDSDATVTTPSDGTDSDHEGDAGGGESDHEADEDGNDYRVEASARGVPLDAIAAREIKAVTFSDMVVEARDDGWYAYVVFDV